MIIHVVGTVSNRCRTDSKVVGSGAATGTCVGRGRDRYQAYERRTELV